MNLIELPDEILYDIIQRSNNINLRGTCLFFVEFWHEYIPEHVSVINAYISDMLNTNRKLNHKLEHQERRIFGYLKQIKMLRTKNSALRNANNYLRNDYNRGNITQFRNNRKRKYY